MTCGKSMKPESKTRRHPGMFSQYASPTGLVWQPGNNNQEFPVAEFFEVENLICLVALTGLEIVLGIDNIVFIAILVGKLPAYQQQRGRRVALTIAMVSRIALLLAIGLVMKLKEHPIFTVLGHEFTVRD